MWGKKWGHEYGFWSQAELGLNPNSSSYQLCDLQQNT